MLQAQSAALAAAWRDDALAALESTQECFGGCEECVSGLFQSGVANLISLNCLPIIMFLRCYRSTKVRFNACLALQPRRNVFVKHFMHRCELNKSIANLFFLIILMGCFIAYVDILLQPFGAQFLHLPLTLHSNVEFILFALLSLLLCDDWPRTFICT